MDYTASKLLDSNTFSLRSETLRSAMQQLASAREAELAKLSAQIEALNAEHAAAVGQLTARVSAAASAARAALIADAVTAFGPLAARWRVEGIRQVVTAIYDARSKLREREQCELGTADLTVRALWTALVEAYGEAAIAGHAVMPLDLITSDTWARIESGLPATPVPPPPEALSTAASLSALEDALRESERQIEYRATQLAAYAALRADWTAARWTAIRALDDAALAAVDRAHAEPLYQTHLARHGLAAPAAVANVYSESHTLDSWTNRGAA